MTRCLVVRLGSLGDLVHTVPAVALIRRAYPAATIDWLVDAVHRPFLEMVPVISSIVVLRDSTVGAWRDVRRTLRDRRYEVALDFQGLIKSAALARFSGATRVIGFETRALRERWAAPFYTERMAVGEARHVVHKNLALLAALDIADRTIEFPLAEVESSALRHVRGLGVTTFALVNPGAAWPNKRWPADRFGALVKHMRDRHGLTSLVLWGPGERPLAEAVIAASDGAAILAPPTELADVVALCRAARLMVSGDTGPLHIAAAVSTPVVALFGPTDPARNGPWSTADVSLSRYDHCACHYQRVCRRPADWCLANIGVDDVLAAVGQRLL